MESEVTFRTGQVSLVYNMSNIVVYNMYIVYEAMIQVYWIFIGKQIHTKCDRVLECFKDTGSVKKDRKQLWMAVPNKIYGTL